MIGSRTCIDYDCSRLRRCAIDGCDGCDYVANRSALFAFATNTASLYQSLAAFAGCHPRDYRDTRNLFVAAGFDRRTRAQGFR